MKKLSVLALTAAIGIASSAVLPAQAQDAGNAGRTYNGSRYGVNVITGSSLEELKDKLSQMDGNMNNIYWQICPPQNTPDNNTPDMPDTDQPGGDTDVTPDTPDTPDTDAPGTDDVPDTDVPGGDTSQPGGDTDKPGTDTEARTFAEQVVDLVNAERAKAGLRALTLDKEIESAALVRAKEIETSFSHTRPNGSSFSTALTEQGITFRGSGENIAWGQRTPEEVMNGWMNSEGHRANIMNSKFKKIGVGYYQNAAGRSHWTQLFTY